MSLHTLSDANTRRKRQSPTKGRNVVDSSPSSEPSLSKLFEDSDDEINDLINTQLEDAHQAQADDPQLDWRTQSQDQVLVEEDDILTDPDETMEVDREVGVPSVMISAEVAAQSRNPVNLANLQVHARYLDFIEHLCDETGTNSLKQYIKDGLKHALHRARSITMDADLSANNVLDTHGFALVIHVWQVLYLRVHYGVFPSHSLASELSVYFLSAYTIIQSHHTVTFPQLKSAVQYWENRLNDAHDCGTWQKQAWLRTIPELDSTNPQIRNDIAHEYIDGLTKGGKAQLAFLIMKKDAAGPHITPLRRYTEGIESKRNWALSELIAILASMDNELLKSLIDGSLSRKAEIPTGDVSNALQRIQDHQSYQPSVYQNCICDLMGISPTPVQWECVCIHMLRYIQGGSESDELAMIVDQLIYPTDKWPPQLARRGLRRYTEWRSYVENDRDQLPSNSHRRMVRYFVSEIMDRISMDLRSGRVHIPLAAPGIEIGFSINPRHRLREHRRHEHSNYLMNLAEAMFKYLHPSTFRLQKLVIYACYLPSQPWFSEIILTQLGQGYTEGAGEFSQYPAGRSNGSAYNRTSKSEWDRFEYEAGRSGLLERELKQIIKMDKQRHKESMQEFEQTQSSLTDELNFLDKLNDTLVSMTRWVNELASGQDGHN